MSPDIDDRIRNVLSQVLHVDASDITEDFSRDSTARWDSLTQMVIVTALEEEFGVTFTDEQVSALLSYKLIAVVLSEMGEIAPR